MDAVSQILLAREQGTPRIAPWVSVAAALHLALVGVAFVMARNGASRPAQMPAVTVRLVQPAARATAGAPEGRPAAPPAAAKATPVAVRPTAVPKPTRSAATPVPVPSKPPARASDSALADPAASATRPAATAPATTGNGDNGDGGGRASGLSLGGAGGGAAAGVPADFQFTYYLERMLALIETHWFKPPVTAGTRAQVGFRITASGRVEAVQLELSSGNSSFDRAVLRAIYAANPLPPLPPAYLKPSLTIHLTFAE